MRYRAVDNSYRLQVNNTGNMAGDETVQLYIRDLVGSVTRPVKELKGFPENKPESAGNEKSGHSLLQKTILKFYNSDLKYVAEAGEFKVYIGTNSCVM